MCDYQALVMHLDQENLAMLAELLAAEEFHVVKGPQTGLLMMVAQDPFATDFCLGEILVTEAATEYQGHRGYALVIGDEAEKALLAALLAAIVQSSNVALKEQIEHLLAPVADKLRQAMDRERRLLATSLVNFETMVKR